MNELIGILQNFIELKSIAVQANNSSELVNIGYTLKDMNSQKVHNKVLHESDIPNKSSQKCSYCNSTGYYAKTCKLNPKN
ncbi:3811_t:CDS:2, partial [Racocetra fulgida]